MPARAPLPPMPSRLPDPLRLTLLAAGLLFVGSCGDSRSEPAARPYQRLDLEPVSGSMELRPSTELERWQEFDEAEGFGAWKVRAKLHEIVEFQGERVLKIVRREGARIEIPAPLRFTADGQLRISLFVQTIPYELTARLMGKDQEVVQRSLRIQPFRGEQEISLRLPNPGVGEWSIERIVLQLPAGEEATGITAISVDDVPFGGHFTANTVGGEYGLIELGTESRRATCLSSDHPLRSRFAVTAAEQELFFSYCLPAEVRLTGEAPQLRLTLRGDEGREQVLPFGFEEGAGTDPRWHTAKAPLGAFHGETVTAIFEFPAAGAPVRICALGQVQLGERQPDAPTVLLITSDTHRSDHVGFLADESWLRTDAIDQLAAEGVVFTDVLSSINNTTPSHVSLFTGLSPRDTGILANLRRLSDAAPTLAERFAELGYATVAAVSASPVNYRFTGLGQGFDRYSTPAVRTMRGSVETLQELYRWLPDYEGVPLFVWVHIYDAHNPYQPPAEYERLYYPGDVDPYDATRPGTDPSIAPGWNPEIADPAYTEALYRSEITYLDEQLAELFAIDRFTAATIVFTADHGEVLSRGKDKRFNHDGLSLDTLAVPLIFRHPGLSAGERRDSPVLQIDVGRTLLNLVGHSEAEFPGRDLFAEEGRFEGPRFGMEANGFSASVILGRWMLLMALRPPTKAQGASFEARHEVKLFDLESDPHCEREVREEHPERVAKLRGLLTRWLTRSDTRDWEAQATVSSADIAQHLADLGYVSDGASGAASGWFDPECDCDWCSRFE